MARLTNIAAMAIAAAASVGSLLAQGGPPARGEQNPPPPAPVVALIGCVERVAPPAQPAGSKAPAVPPAFKLVDVQAGGGSPVVDRSGTPPQTAPPAKARAMVVDKEYVLSAPDTIKLRDYENQRVEATGTLSAIPDAVPGQPQRGEPPSAPAAPRLSLLKLMTVKVVSTECKQ